MLNNLTRFFQAIVATFTAIFSYIGTASAAVTGVFSFIGGLISSLISGLIGGLGNAATQNTDFLIGLAIIGGFIYAVIVLRSKEGTLATKATNIAIVFSGIFAGIMTGAEISNSNSSNDNVSTILVYLADIYIY
ncbi:MAG: hypothetical protein F6K40_06020 [Okeania sp. SIO3I5]|uniref:hypothetical protein n=1 Tax=Okeania sp. SIO3I5 TaxID=2607805 RepID=UPI0013B79697|nr:hypothetical protein [Okeania sp. SIO3I5]NEQ35864.1 hypothetical protein [Okeania sp. SIO3I5]